MSDKTIAERLQPSLLDRLTDNDPSEKSERRDDRVIDVRQLREIIQRDLAWLLNTSDNSTIIDAKLYPNVAQSTLNFGIHEVAGHPGSVDVALRVGKDDRDTIVTYDIRADMWAQPLPMELYLRSQVDVTTGELELERIA